MQSLLYQILRGVQYKLRTTGALTFADLISFLCSNTFDWDGGNGFVWR